MTWQMYPFPPWSSPMHSLIRPFRPKQFSWLLLSEIIFAVELYVSRMNHARCIFILLPLPLWWCLEQLIHIIALISAACYHFCIVLVFHSETRFLVWHLLGTKPFYTWHLSVPQPYPGILSWEKHPISLVNHAYHFL